MYAYILFINIIFTEKVQNPCCIVKQPIKELFLPCPLHVTSISSSHDVLSPIRANITERRRPPAGYPHTWQPVRPSARLPACRPSSLYARPPSNRLDRGARLPARPLSSLPIRSPARPLARSPACPPAARPLSHPLACPPAARPASTFARIPASTVVRPPCPI